ncbi:MAG: L,D-transpeptidase [Myxococcota bacterium]
MRVVCAAAVVALLAAGCREEESPPSEEPAEAMAANDEPVESPDPPEPVGPPKRIFTKRFVVNVRTEPNREAPRIGYLRGGAVLQATGAEAVGHEGCRGGWFELSTGGYVCNGRDVIAFEGEKLPEVRSAQPDPSRKLPYEYGFIRKDHTPVYRRLPNEEQVRKYEKPHRASEPDRAAPVAEDAGADGGAGGDADPAGDAEDAGPPTLDRLQASDEDAEALHRWLMRGFYVSLDRTFDVRWRRYWRTQQNGFVPYQNVMRVEGSDFHGVDLDAVGWSLPVGFVISGRTRRYVSRDDGRLRPDREKPGYHHVFRVVSERQERGRLYYEGHEGYFYRADDVVRVDARERPSDVQDSKWVDVDLSSQTLVAYEDDQAVYVTLISSGRVRREDVPELNHATPAGTFRFSSKHLTHTMDGDNAIDGPYSIDDVPYVMYFEGAYATHAAFWHNRFGRPKSHGCINMAPLDARWVFEWADPELPERWHGIYPGDEGPHTSIVIHGETPKG